MLEMNEKYKHQWENIFEEGAVKIFSFLILCKIPSKKYLSVGSAQACDIYLRAISLTAFTAANSFPGLK